MTDRRRLFLPSRLKKRVTIEQPVLTADTGGGFVRSWATLATVWAEITPVNAREALQAQQLEGRVTHRIIIRYRNDIRTSMRIAYGSRTLNIRTVIDVEEAGEALELLAEENVVS